MVNFSGNNDLGYKARGRGIYPWPRLHHQGLEIMSEEMFAGFPNHSPLLTMFRSSLFLYSYTKYSVRVKKKFHQGALTIVTFW